MYHMSRSLGAEYQGTDRPIRVPRDIPLPLIPEYDPSLPAERPERQEIPIQPRVPPPDRPEEPPEGPGGGVEIIAPGTDIGTRIKMLDF